MRAGPARRPRFYEPSNGGGVLSGPAANKQLFMEQILKYFKDVLTPEQVQRFEALQGLYAE